MRQGMLRVSAYAAADEVAYLAGGDALLNKRVAVADRDRLILDRLPIDGEAERSPDFVLTAVATADRAGLVIETREVRSQFSGQLLGELRHAVFLDEREDAGL